MANTDGRRTRQKSVRPERGCVTATVKEANTIGQWTKRDGIRTAVTCGWRHPDRIRKKPSRPPPSRMGELPRMAQSSEGAGLYLWLPAHLIPRWWRSGDESEDWRNVEREPRRDSERRSPNFQSHFPDVRRTSPPARTSQSIHALASHHPRYRSNKSSECRS
ncbi:hypothetical protein LZ30DRAFT_334842 [Colletotrichum cereale]|nr:hypothetical protein LZ30DRAFT_334842 [Colletotrichum cereale]